MNDERMPINLYKLNFEGGHEMTEAELKEQKRHDVQPWIFLICMGICFGLILVYISTKGTMDMLFVIIAFFVLVALMITLSLYKIIRILNVK